MFATVAKSAFEKNFDKNQKLEEEGRTELNKDFVLPKSSSKDGVKDKKKVIRSDDDDSDESEDDIVGPLPPPPGSNEDLRTRKSDNPDVDDEEEREETPVDKIPHSHEVELSHGDKPITSLALDPSGSRVITGSADYELKFWDFAGKAFKKGLKNPPTSATILSRKRSLYNLVLSISSLSNISMIFENTSHSFNNSS